MERGEEEGGQGGNRRGKEGGEDRIRDHTNFTELPMEKRQEKGGGELSW